MSDRKICPQCGVSYPAEERFCPKDGAALRADSEGTLVGSVLADRYLILSTLGQGGMGQVYLAEHLRMKRKSAVKVMRADLAHDPGAAARFNREAEHASQILHPNVAAIFDFGETKDGLLYLAMEYVQGESLARVAARGAALPPARVASLVAQIADGLAAAHERGIVHRDLKPDNIIVTVRKDGSELAKIVDFGIAKAMQREGPALTQTGYSLGTPEYMSPEQLTADVVDARADIYALGLITFGMLAGDLPFPAGTSRESLVLRLTSRPRTLAEVRQGVAWPPQLQAVLDRALATEPAERYQTVREFATALTSAIETLRAAPPAELPTAIVDGRDAARDSTAAVPKRRMAPWLGAGIALLLLLLAAIVAKQGRDRRTAVVTGSAAVGGRLAREEDPTAIAADTARDAAEPTANASIAAAAAPRRERDRSVEGAGAPSPGATPSRAERLRALDSLLRANINTRTPDRPALEAALADIERAMPRMRGVEQGRARFTRAVLHALLGDTAQACRELQTLRAQMRDRRRRDGTDAYLRRTCGGPR